MIESLSVQRPSAKELLKHPFLKRAKKTSFLVELIDRFKTWKANGGDSKGDRDDWDSESYEEVLRFVHSFSGWLSLINFIGYFICFSA